MKILLIGCGKMGGAMLSAWLAKGCISSAIVIDPGVAEIRQAYASFAHPLEVCARLQDMRTDVSPDMVVLAVKPQQMAAVLADLRSILRPEWPVMTIAAGLRVSFYARHFPENPVIRVMPNLPVMIGQGMTVGVLPENLSPTAQSQAEKLLFATGDFFWLAGEEQIDAAMAISGSGPAYFFYLAEAMAKAGVASGLSQGNAMRLARQTLAGSGALLAQFPEQSAEQFRKNVTSPGGVTEATLKRWATNQEFENLVQAGMDVNTQRALELAEA